MEKICKVCGIKFITDDKRRRFCSKNCYHKYQIEDPNKGTFKYRKESVWNNGLKGIHLSIKSEFKKGQVCINRKSIGTITKRLDKNLKLRKWIKIEEPARWELLSIYNWKKYNGKITKGYIIHHKDFNHTNDKIDNLTMITRSEHINLHRCNFKIAEARINNYKE